MKLPLIDRDEASAGLFENFARVKKEGSRAFLLTGRRGTGKTSLVTRTFGAGPVPFVYLYVNPLMTREGNLRTFWRENDETLGLKGFQANQPSFAELVRFVLERSASEPMVLVVDECQHLGTLEPDFFAEWEKTWETLQRKTKTLLVFIGSDGTALRSLLANPDAKRFFEKIERRELPSFRATTVKRLLREQRPDCLSEDWLTLFFLTGGVPHYVKAMLEAGATDAAAMLHFALQPDGLLMREGERILREEFRDDCAVYLETLARIASGVTRRSDLLASFKERNVESQLYKLEHHFRLIRREEPLGGVANNRGYRFALTDPFLVFWFQCIHLNRALLEKGDEERLREKVVAELPDILYGATLRCAWMDALRESGEHAEVGSWWDRRGENEIDVVAVNPTKKEILFGELRREPSSGDDGRLRSRAYGFLAQNPKYAGYEPRFACLTSEELQTGSGCPNRGR